MRVDWLELSQFRNYSSLRIELPEATTFLLGANGAGKSNLVEAIAYLGVLASFRGSPDRALVSTGSPQAVLRAEIVDKVSSHRIEIGIPIQGARQIRVNGKRPRRHSDLRSVVRTVVFAPGDLELVQGGDGLRRDMLDDLASQTWPAAGAAQDSYREALRHRNALLREEVMAPPASFEVWEEVLGQSGSEVVSFRRQGLSDLQSRATRVYSSVAGDDRESLVIDYTPSWESQAASQTAQGLSQALAESRGHDRARGLTTVGPHRDGVQLRLGQRPARTHASQGEQRSMVLALRMAAFDSLEVRYGEPPILLLDDVFSELDSQRVKAVMERLPGAQVIVTGTHEPEFALPGSRARVEGGQLRWVES